MPKSLAYGSPTLDLFIIYTAASLQLRPLLLYGVLLSNIDFAPTNHASAHARPTVPVLRLLLLCTEGVLLNSVAKQRCNNTLFQDQLAAKHFCSHKLSKRQCTTTNVMTIRNVR